MAKKRSFGHLDEMAIKPSLVAQKVDEHHCNIMDQVLKIQNALNGHTTATRTEIKAIIGKISSESCSLNAWIRTGDTKNVNCKRHSHCTKFFCNDNCRLWDPNE